MTYDDAVKLMPGVAAIIAIVGTIMAAYLTFKLNAARSEKLDRAKRAEETYVLFVKWVNLMTAGIMPWASVKPGGLTYDQANDLFIESAKNSPGDLYPRLRFSVLLLFPELIDLLNEVWQHNEMMTKKLGRAKMMYRETGDYDGFNEIDWMAYAKTMDEIDKKIDDEFIKVINKRKLA